jgi:cytochrome P450
MRFARLEMKLALATLLREWEFDLLSDPEPSFTAAATMRPAEEIRVRVRRREG